MKKIFPREGPPIGKTKKKIGWQTKKNDNSIFYMIFLFYRPTLQKRLETRMSTNKSNVHRLRSNRCVEFDLGNPWQNAGPLVTVGMSLVASAMTKGMTVIDLGRGTEKFK